MGGGGGRCSVPQGLWLAPAPSLLAPPPPKLCGEWGAASFLPPAVLQAIRGPDLSMGVLSQVPGLPAEGGGAKLPPPPGLSPLGSFHGQGTSYHQLCGLTQHISSLLSPGGWRRCSACPASWNVFYLRPGRPGPRVPPCARSGWGLRTVGGEHQSPGRRCGRDRGHQTFHHAPSPRVRAPTAGGVNAPGSASTVLGPLPQQTAHPRPNAGAPLSQPPKLTADTGTNCNKN